MNYGLALTVRRANLRETSYLRKVLQYREVVGCGRYRTHFGMKSTKLVLTVTTNVQHMHHIIGMSEEVLGRDVCPYMLFTVAPEFGDQRRIPDPYYQLLTEPWQRVRLPEIRIDRANEAA